MPDQLQLGESSTLVILRQAWEKSLSLLAPEITGPTFESFVKPARPLSFEGNLVTLGAASELGKLFLDKYAELIRTALEANLGTEIELRVIIAPQEKEKQQSSSTTAKAAKKAEATLSPLSLPLNEKYVFPSFIVGPCNRLAHAAAVAVAKKPARTYNPLFLYGGPGLGKTHLLQAVGHHILASHPGARIAYVSGETFTFQYVSALREHRSEDFRRKYRAIDVWLVDDIQFLAGKERTKEEFFHTFNALYQTNKQIVMSSDRAPKDLNPLEERLRSRFESGLVADLAPPDLETRMAILQKKAQAEEAEVPDIVLERVAELIRTNVRALEGALVTLLAYSSLMKSPLSPDMAEEILARYLIDRKYAELTPDIVQRVVAQAFGVESEAIRGQQRTRELALARHVAMYLSKELTDNSLIAIGKAFGGRDHSTIVHACNKVKTMLEDDESLRHTVDGLTEDLRAGRCG